jgi:hypothetical protein
MSLSIPNVSGQNLTPGVTNIFVNPQGPSQAETTAQRVKQTVNDNHHSVTLGVNPSAATCLTALVVLQPQLVKDTVGGAATIASNAGGWAKEKAFDPVYDKAAEFFSSTVTMVDGKEVVTPSPFMQYVNSGWTYAKEKATNGFNHTWEFFSSTEQSASELFKPWTWGTTKTIPSPAWQMVENAGNKVYGVGETVVAGTYNLGAKAAGKVYEAGAVVGNAGYNAGAAVVNAGYNAGAAIGNAGYNAGAAVVNAGYNAGAAIGNAGQKAGEAVYNAGAAVGNAGYNAGAAVVNAGYNAGAAIGNAGQKAGEAVYNAGAAVGNAGYNAGAAVVNAGYNAGAAIVEGAGKAWTATSSAVSNAAAQVLATLGKDTGMRLFGYTVTYGGVAGLVVASAALGITAAYLTSGKK